MMKYKTYVVFFSDMSPLHEACREGYTCVAHSVLGLVYMPNNFVGNVNINSVNDVTCHPKSSASEVVLTPIVSVTPHMKMEKPAIIELMKTTTVRHIVEKKVIPMFSDSNIGNWKALSEECEELEDRIAFKTTIFGNFTVTAQFLSPTASILVDPKASACDTIIELAVPEVPQFSLKIPSKSVPSASQVKATLHFPEFNDGVENSPASICVELEPHGQVFTQNLSLQIPVPGYSRIMKANSNAKLQLVYCHSVSFDERNMKLLQEKDMKLKIVGNDVIVTILINHFSFWQIVWSNVDQVKTVVSSVVKSAYNYVFAYKGRCQVFMSEEKQDQKSSNLIFSIRVRVYPFQEYSCQMPINYHYVLHDSGSLPIPCIPGEVQFSLEFLKRFKKNGAQSKYRQLSYDYPEEVDFCVELNKESKSMLLDGGVMAKLTILQDAGGKELQYDLIKVNSTYNDALTLQKCCKSYALLLLYMSAALSKRKLYISFTCSQTKTQNQSK